ncbi:hypothetical protein MTR67_051014 [Solanum verrucosum]|uniref:Uncharacterized protein n=1 Tax=Solanum verrucosum TaxID=315347 RepID=A0AAF0V5L9_SOLVR|nr:hypothetical protein MTR67_051014 [Solanum verrucosum]
MELEEDRRSQKE